MARTFCTFKCLKAEKEEFARLREGKTGSAHSKGNGILGLWQQNLLGIADLENVSCKCLFTYSGNAGLTATFIIISNLLGVAASYLSKRALQISARSCDLSFLSVHGQLCWCTRFNNSTWI